MALRRQVTDASATYEDPIYGINLRSNEQDLMPGEARLMENYVFDGGTRSRLGSARITETTLQSALRIRGLHKFYYGGATPTSKRLVAYGTKISHINDAGTEVILTSGMTSDLDTYFGTWPITDKVYISNGMDVLRQYDGTTLSTLTGTNIPIPRSPVVPVLDRLMCITANGIERTNPRVDNVWSQGSSWATFRPQQAGLFTALHPGTLKGTDAIYNGAFAFQANAYYIITGGDFGSDVTAATPSTGEDGSIQIMDSRVGTSSPYSVVTVPSVGTFFFTSDLNIYMIPEGSLTGKYVGDKLRSNQGSTPGIESTNRNALSQVWMAHWNRYLIISIPIGSDSYPTTQFWMDLRNFDVIQSSKESKNTGVVWYGPMTGQSVGRAFAETQNADSKLVGGEGNPLTSAFVYDLHRTARYTDAIGTADTAYPLKYQTYFKDLGWASREKLVRAVHADMQVSTGTVLCNIYDLEGLVQSNIPFEDAP